MRVYAWIYVIFLYAPIALLPLFAFNDSTIIAFPLKGFTTEWFRVLLDIPALHQATFVSARIALVTATLATVLGLCAARAGVGASFFGKRAALGLVMVPLVLPEIIVAVALLILFLQMGFSIGQWSVIAGHVLVAMPFAIAILNTSFQSLDPSLEEAARDLGETPATAFYRVTLPLVWPGIVAAFLI